MRRGFFPAVIIGFSLLSYPTWAQTNACDLVAPTGSVDKTDVQAAIDMALGIRTCPSTINIAGAGICNAVVVQRVINAALGGPCSTPTNHGVTLTWAASTSANVAAYYVYRSSTAGGPYVKVAETTATVLTYDDKVVQAGLTYYYVVTAVDASKNESAYSTEVKASIPTP